MEKTNIMVEFSLYGEGFSPETITEELSIKPTETWSKGDVIKNRNIIRKETCWSISTGYKESLDINDQLQTILALIRNKKSELKEIKHKYGLEYTFEVVIRIEQNQTPAVYLNKETIEFLNDIESGIDFDMYVF